jgi:hypothetical protein
MGLALGNALGLPWRKADGRWTPRALGANLLLWVDPSDAATITLGTPPAVASILNKGNIPGSFSQAVVAAQPTLSTTFAKTSLRNNTAAGVPVSLDWTGSLSAIGFLLGNATDTEMELWGRIRYTNIGTPAGAAWIEPVSAVATRFLEARLTNANSDFQFVSVNTSIQLTASGGTPVVNVSNTWRLRYTNTPKSWQLFIDGTSIATDVAGTGGTSWSHAMSLFGFIATAMRGYIGQVIGINRLLTASEVPLMTAWNAQFLV